MTSEAIPQIDPLFRAIRMYPFSPQVVPYKDKPNHHPGTRQFIAANFYPRIFNEPEVELRFVVMAVAHQKHRMIEILRTLWIRVDTGPIICQRFCCVYSHSDWTVGSDDLLQAILIPVELFPDGRGDGSCCAAFLQALTFSSSVRIAVSRSETIALDEPKSQQRIATWKRSDF